MAAGSEGECQLLLELHALLAKLTILSSPSRVRVSVVLVGVSSQAPVVERCVVCLRADCRLGGD